jgi:acetolactate synthase-1/2/3 large subunit
VVHITGDGALGFHIQEFDTMARRGLPVLTVVLNNKVWGMSIHGQQMMFGPNYQVITALGDTDYASIARAFGCHGERVESLEAIGPAVERALASGKPACLELMVDPAIVQPGTTAMLGAVQDETREIMIPYYENIPIR